MNTIENSSKPRILLVEDDEDIQELLFLQLTKHSFNVMCASDGALAKKMIDEEEPFQLFILDWMIPPPTGIELCAYIRAQKGLNIPILMLTAKASPSFIIEGLDSGADDYINKPFNIDVLLARVKALLRRGTLSHMNPSSDLGSAFDAHFDSVLTLGPIKIDEVKHEVLCGGHKIQLTLSELKILKGLMKRPGHVFTRSQLIEEISGPSVHVSGRTIDTQLVGLRKKLGEYSSYIETIRGIGYKFTDQL